MHVSNLCNFEFWVVRYTCIYRIEEVTWVGASILVMGQVLVSPPYLPENVREHKDSKENNTKTLNYIRKIVRNNYFVQICRN